MVHDYFFGILLDTTNGSQITQCSEKSANTNTLNYNKFYNIAKSCNNAELSFRLVEAQTAITKSALLVILADQLPIGATCGRLTLRSPYNLLTGLGLTKLTSRINKGYSILYYNSRNLGATGLKI